ncbi:urease accessory protein UreD [Undibacterium sp. RuRC25W]|uniref:urease accessory protein UreD n=1 Tax=Undibacterium sp. RuRC25W TaxID=3413047 RepID=UPI003BF080D9
MNAPVLATNVVPNFVPASIVQAKTHWHARLQLGFADDIGTTRLIERQHSGPLRVQKPLYPEGERICHAIVIHPPGGVVGGDQLEISVKVGEHAHALITTPGAAKWYRCNGYTSEQRIDLHVASDAHLEWLPQETIFFDDAKVNLHQTVHLQGSASFIASDILCFGRTASDERYTSGVISQRSSIFRDGKMIWFEQGRIGGADAAMQSPLGLNGKSVCAMVLACGHTLSSDQLQQLREQTVALISEGEPEAACGVTQMKTVIVARYLGHSSEIAKQWQQLVWQHLRPVINANQAVIPRIWNT